ncbi:MAG: tRNA (adenosine(37)-N6)-threonylcarbamoyltransferase complex transferase subunit TsaD [Phycisphaerae bacterium]
MQTTILGIETSCDETAAAVVRDGQVLSNVVASQIDLHAKYGGVVPEIASRAHLERLDAIVDEAMSQASCDVDDISAIAVTHRPGLIGALLMGLTAAKTLAWCWNKPLIAVDHIRAHATSAMIGIDVTPFPGIALVVSGGHTSLFDVASPHEINELGSTIDDAAGEAFDKVAAILQLGYPGGPVIQKASDGGDPKAVAFPRTMLKPGSLDFSFSGIKTAVLYTVHGQGKTEGGLESLTPERMADIAASFQQAVVDVLVKKTIKAVQDKGYQHVLLGGGVAANRCLRTCLESACDSIGVRLHAPPMSLCTDNAAMIAALAEHMFARGEVTSLEVDAFPTGV